MFAYNYNYNIIKKAAKIVFIFFLVFSFCFSQTALASRSNAGGGELAHFDAGKWAIGTAIGMATSSLCGGIGSRFTGGTFSGGMSAGFNNWGNNYAVTAASSQTSRAVQMASAYYGWGTKTSMIASSAAAGAVSGGLNSGSIITGALRGATEGAVLYSISSKGTKIKPWMYSVAGLAGAGVSAGIGSFSGSQTGNYTASTTTAAANRTSANINTARGSTFLGNMTGAVINESIGLGIRYATENISDSGNKYIATQALSGLYQLTSGTSNNSVSNIQSSGYRAGINTSINNLSTYNTQSTNSSTYYRK